MMRLIRGFKSCAVRFNSPLSQYDIFSQSSVTSPLLQSVGNHGITVGDLRLRGPAVILNNSIFLWDVPQFGIGGPEPVATADESESSKGDPASPFYGWTEDVFKLFDLVEPAPEILVIGSGPQTYQLPPHLKSHLGKRGIQIEIMDSRNAGSTYNVLAKEGRRVAAAILPPVPTSARTGKALVEISRKRPEES